MYNIIFDKKALEHEHFVKLDKTTKLQIWKKLQESKENPHHFLEHLKEINIYKLRIGHYRAIADIDNEEQKIIILKIGHRKHVYDF